jgi:nitrogen fixation/metabolism regulation signal transduction histidine kinase
MRFGLQGKAVLLLLAVALVPLGAALLLVGQIGVTAERVAANEIERLRSPLEHAGDAYREAVAARKDAFRASAALAATDPGLPGLCDGGDARVFLQQLLAGDPRLGRAALLVNGEERAAVSREFGEEMRLLDLSQEVRGRPACALALRFGFPAGLLDEQQAIGAALREGRFLGRVHTHLPQSYWNTFALLFGAVVAAVTVVAIVVARRTSKRLTKLSEATRRLADGDLEARVDARIRDEIGDLGRDFNRMVEDLQRSRAEIEYLQKIGAWQEVARRLAHEIKNPLTPIQLAVQQLASKYDGADPRFARMLKDASEIVTEEVAGLRRLVDAFSGFAKLPRVEPAPLDLAVLAEDAARDHQGVALEPPASPVRVHGDKMLLKRALTNLVDNAREAGATTVKIGWRAAGERAVLTVDDDGPGVAPEMVARLFDPYVTSKERGTGLGLAIVKKTLLDHGGDVTLAPARSPLGGARFEVTLPLDR